MHRALASFGGVGHEHGYYLAVVRKERGVVCVPVTGGGVFLEWVVTLDTEAGALWAGASSKGLETRS